MKLIRNSEFGTTSERPKGGGSNGTRGRRTWDVAWVCDVAPGLPSRCGAGTSVPATSGKQPRGVTHEGAPRGRSLLFWRDGRPAAVFAAQVDDRLRFRATDDPGARHAAAGADDIARLSLAHRWLSLCFFGRRPSGFWRTPKRWSTRTERSVVAVKRACGGAQSPRAGLRSLAQAFLCAHILAARRLGAQFSRRSSSIKPRKPLPILPLARSQDVAAERGIRRRVRDDDDEEIAGVA